MVDHDADDDDAEIALSMTQAVHRLRALVARRLEHGHPVPPLDQGIRWALGRYVTRHRRLRRALVSALTPDERRRWAPPPPPRPSVCLVCDPAMTNGAAGGLPPGPGRP